MLQGSMKNHTDGVPASKWTGVNEGMLAEFEYQKNKKTHLMTAGRRATSLSVGQPWLQLLNLQVKGYIFSKLSLKWIEPSWTRTVAE